MSWPLLSAWNTKRALIVLDTMKCVTFMLGIMPPTLDTIIETAAAFDDSVLLC